MISYSCSNLSAESHSVAFIGDPRGVPVAGYIAKFSFAVLSIVCAVSITTSQFLGLFGDGICKNSLDCARDEECVIGGRYRDIMCQARHDDCTCVEGCRLNYRFFYPGKYEFGVPNEEDIKCRCQKTAWGFGTYEWRCVGMSRTQAEAWASRNWKN
ncbi:hypothetical protein ScPMuIL_014768 [Solemya velum]